MAITRWWSSDEAFALVRRAHPFRERCVGPILTAPWTTFPVATPMAALGSRRVCAGNDDRFTIVNPRVAALLRRNLGTILAEEPRAIRLLLPAESEKRSAAAPSIAIGSVDDAYADRLRPGDRLLLDGRCLEFRRRKRGALLVDEVSTRPVVPRWSGSGWALSRELAERLFLFRMQAADALRDGKAYLCGWLMDDYSLGRNAAAELAELFILQETVSEIPDAHTLLIETVVDDVTCYYFHTPLARPGNDALARVLAWRLLDRGGLVAQSEVADLGFTLAVPSAESINPSAWRTLLDESKFDGDLAQALTTSDALRDRFANVATTGLMVLRQPLGGRRKVGGHDWAARRLFDQVRDHRPAFHPFTPGRSGD